MWANGISDLLHYLDNYFMAGPPGSGNCQCNINKMVEVCRELGFAVNPSKVTAPSPITCFLGIEIDSHEGVAHIDPKHLQAIINELAGFWQAKSATKCEVLSLIGKLHFVYRVYPWEEHSYAEWLRPPRRHATYTTILNWMQSSVMMSSGGSPTFPAGTGSASSTMQTGSAPQM